MFAAGTGRRHAHHGQIASWLPPCRAALICTPNALRNATQAPRRRCIGARSATPAEPASTSAKRSNSATMAARVAHDAQLLQRVAPAPRQQAAGNHAAVFRHGVSMGCQASNWPSPAWAAATVICWPIYAQWASPSPSSCAGPQVGRGARWRPPCSTALDGVAGVLKACAATTAGSGCRWFK